MHFIELKGSYRSLKFKHHTLSIIFQIFITGPDQYNSTFIHIAIAQWLLFSTCTPLNKKDFHAWLAY